jgi:hypothetical protein
MVGGRLLVGGQKMKLMSEAGKFVWWVAIGELHYFVKSFL